MLVSYVRVGHPGRRPRLGRGSPRNHAGSLHPRNGDAPPAWSHAGEGMPAWAVRRRKARRMSFVAASRSSGGRCSVSNRSTSQTVPDLRRSPRVAIVLRYHSVSLRPVEGYIFPPSRTRARPEGLIPLSRATDRREDASTALRAAERIASKLSSVGESSVCMGPSVIVGCAESTSWAPERLQ